MSHLKFESAAKFASERTVLPIHDPASLDHSCRRALEIAREKLNEIADLPLSDASTATVFDKWDDIEMMVEDVFGPVSLLNEVHPVAAVRNIADDRMIDFSAFVTEVYQDPDLFARVRAVEPSSPAEEMFRKDLIESFEDSGVVLDENARWRFRKITERIAELSQQFAKNIREQAPSVRFSRDEIDGMPPAIIDSLETDGEDVLVSLDYPQYNPFMMNVHDEDARKRLFLAYLQRGGEANIEMLDEIVELRREIASLYELETFAHYVTRRRMVKDPETVQSFLDRVLTAVREREQRDIEELRRAKADASGKELAETEIHRWDLAYWSERVRESKFAIDQEDLRRYFPAEPSIRWVLHVSEKLYGIRFERIDVPVWHRDVLYFDVIDQSSGQFIGGVYLDLYPREGKYKHAAAWPVRGASTRTGRKPVSVLVTNFDRRGMTHRELETFLHEFGHVLHGVLSTTWYNLHSGTAVERDFVEAPSQMFEEWGRRLESLSLMSEICPDCPEIDADLVDRLEAARRFGKGIHYARQHLYASYDMSLAGSQPGGALERWRQMESETPLGYVEDTMFPAGFAHITGGYAAGYYGYLWSETIASDLVSMFGEDLMDPETGQRFRETVLARGGETPARELVKNFLGREPSPESFIEDLRILEPMATEPH